MKNKRILIIGAGASGISVAHYLKKKGYKSITVMEKEKRVGGKCYTIKYKNKYYEMGAMMGVPSYKNMIKLMKKVDIKNDGPYLYRDFFDCTGKRIEQVPLKEIVDFKKQFKELPRIIDKYKKYINAPTHKNMPSELCVPFSQWCENNNISMVTYAYAPPFTAFGYGDLKEIPAIYVLRFLSYETLCYFINIIHLITLTEGMQSFWEKLSDDIDDLRLGVNINSIKREDKVIVNTEFGTYEFDELIITSPLDETEDFLDVRKDEQELFSKIKYNNYNVFAYSVDNLPKVSGYVPYNFTKDRYGHVLVWYYRWQKSEMNDIVTFYSLTDDNTNVLKAKKILESDLIGMGIEVKRLYMHHQWKYFPHVTSEDLKNGFYDKLESLQGKYSTYYAGEIMNFSNMEKCCEYSRYIVKTYF